MLIPNDFSAALATSSSMSCATPCTLFSIDPWSVGSLIVARKWSANDICMTSGGCPSAAARLASLLFPMS